MEFLTYENRQGVKAIFRTETGERYAVQVLAAPAPGVDSGRGPVEASFALHRGKWEMPVGPALRDRFPDKTLSVIPDLNGVIEEMFARLADFPQVIYKGDIDELANSKI